MVAVALEYVPNSVSFERRIAAKSLERQDAGGPGAEERFAPIGERGIAFQQGVWIGHRLVEHVVDLRDPHWAVPAHPR